MSKLKNENKKNKSNTKIEKKFDQENKNLAKLKLLVIIVKRGQGNAINQILFDCNSASSFITFGEGTKYKYLVDILGGEEDKKEVIFSIINENNYAKIKEKITARFNVSKAAKGVMLCIDINSIASVFAYKYLSDFEGVNVYGK